MKRGRWVLRSVLAGVTVTLGGVLVAAQPADCPASAESGASNAQTQKAIASLRQAFDALPDERSRAAGWYLQLLAADVATVGAQDEALAGLARLASTSADPQVYGLALQSCSVMRLRIDAASNPDVPACASLNPAQWARLAPHSVRAHFGVAARARAAGDAAGELDALHRASTATSFDDGVAWMGRLVYAALPASDTAKDTASSDEGRFGVIYRLIALRLASSNDGLQSIARACSTAALADSNRQALCTALTGLLLRSDSLLERSLGARFGERFGLPAEASKAAMQPLAMSREPWFAEASGTGCVGGKKLARYLEDMLAFGEIDAIRRAAERAAR